MIFTAIICATVKIKGSRPILFNNFTNESIPLQKKEKAGVAGNNPQEWMNTFLVTNDHQLYLEARYIFGCLRAGAKFVPKGRGTLEPSVSSTLQILDEKILLNRFLPFSLTTDNSEAVYIDIRPVSRRGVKNIRYRLAISKDWETEFRIAWDNTLISVEQMESVCIDAGQFAGLGDGRKIGFGRFEVIKFECSAIGEFLNAQEKNSKRDLA